MYVELPKDEGCVGDTRKVNGLTYKKQTNGRWLLVRNKRLRSIVTKLYCVEELTLRGITDRTGIPHSSMQRILNDFGLMRKKKSMSDEDASKFCRKNHTTLVAMYLNEGLTRSSIAKAVVGATGLPFTSKMLSRYFDSVGVYRRNHSESIAEATKHGRMVTRKRGELLFSKRAIASWDYHLDMDLRGLTYAQYKRIVRRFTYMTVSRYPDLFPEGTHTIDRWLIGNSADTHLDHQYSISNGYYEFDGRDYLQRDLPVPLTVMCHPCNLKLLTAKANMIKSSSNHISLEDLTSSIAEFERKHGDIFDDYYGNYAKDSLVTAYSKRKDSKLKNHTLGDFANG